MTVHFVLRFAVGWAIGSAIMSILAYHLGFARATRETEEISFDFVETLRSMFRSMGVDPPDNPFKKKRGRS